MFNKVRRDVAAGWVAITVSTIASMFWSYWGSIEAFYEGWYYRSIWMNLALTFVQYLLPTLVLVAAAILAILWRRVGSLIHLVLAVAIATKINTRVGIVLVAFPLIILAVLYWFGRIQEKKLPMRIVCGLPLATLVIAGAWPAFQVSRRVDDGYRGERLIAGTGIKLRWAPAGPGWPERGTNWHEARRICSSLAAAGDFVTVQPQNIWRLPTAGELVHSMTLHGLSADGEWDGKRGVASYHATPEKESPLWNPYSPVIYWWTSTEANDQKAYRFSYNGRAMATLKTARPAYYGFRCVAEP